MGSRELLLALLASELTRLGCRNVRVFEVGPAGRAVFGNKGGLVACSGHEARCALLSLPPLAGDEEVWRALTSAQKTVTTS
jgi:hypothetical protein